MAKSVLSAKHFQDEAAAFAFVEAALWPDGPPCPHCGATSEHVGRLQGKTTRVGLHKCYACKKPFTVRMDTIFESSHLPLHLWLQVIHLMCASKKGISARQIQRMLQCSMKTAWFLGHRIRETMAPGADVGPLGGKGKIVEVDETYLAGARSRGKPRFQQSRESMKVMSLVERGGKIRSQRIKEATKLTACDVLRANTREKFGINDVSRAEFALKSTKGKRLTYRTVGGASHP